jgi:putative transposase
MPQLDENFQKCLECDKYYRSRPITGCRVCRELEFEEGILCDLNRAIQDSPHFFCHAFHPRLHLAGQAEDTLLSSPALADRKSRHKSIQEIMASDKFKYQKALALQQLNRDPDGFFVELKYHLAWNVRHRKPIFAPEKEYLDFVIDTLLGCGDLVGGVVRLLWLAPDHLHLYIESDGGKSLESIIRRLKSFLNKTILSKFPMLKKGLDKGSTFWDKAYFTETLG